MERLCTVEDCERVHLARGYCHNHYRTMYESKAARMRPTPCFVCGVVVMKKPSGSKTRRAVCSNLCRYYISWGKWPQSRLMTKAVALTKWTTGYDWPQCQLPARHPARQVQPPPLSFVAGLCAQCGKPFVGKARVGATRYCSKACGRRAAHAEARHKRRAASHGALHEPSLSWRTVAQRNGDLICYICATECDVNDYTITTEGHFIVGPLYPSLEHIIPLSKGGQHSSDNADLAHFRCNYEKSDTVGSVRRMTEQLAFFAA